MSLQPFFQAQSVAVVGASRTKRKVGNEVLVSLIEGGFEGAIYPVNPKADAIEGIPCHKSLRDIGEVPDLVVIVLPAKMVPRVMEECASLGARAVVIISSGFKEFGPDGDTLEREVIQIARRGGIRFIGPNCLGILSPSNKLNASFAGELPPTGGIAYVSQSGSLLASILDMAVAEDIEFSRLLSIGNKANVDELDVLRALGDDPETTVIAGYLETITDGDAFIREAERISRKKPILLMKSGETDAGARAASFHTGRLATEAMAYECVFERAGVIRCESITAQFDYALALSSQPLPAGTNVAVIANAGGPSIMAADAIERQGLTLASFAPETLAHLEQALPHVANISNPIDLMGDALTERFQVAVRAALDDANVHSLLLVLSPHAMTECAETARMIVAASREDHGKPILACFLGASRMTEAVAILRDGKVPRYRSPEAAVAAIKAMNDHARWRSRPERIVKLFPVNRRKVELIIERHLRRGALEIGEMESQEILEAYGFVTPRGAVATSAEQAVNLAEQIGYPIVLKIWSPDILHKTEVGGVKTGLTSRQEVMDAFDLMMYRVPRKAPDADILGVLVQEMCTKGRECILGMNRDPRFGPLMMFGMGGVFVEVLRDVAFYLAPLTYEEAREMLLSTRTYHLLQGVGDQEPVDIDVVAEGLQRLSQLVTEFPQIQEMDINPFMVGPEGTTPIAVDARISVADGKSRGTT